MNKKVASETPISIAPAMAYQLTELHSAYPRGAKIILETGNFEISKTIKLPSNTSIQGQGHNKTTITLLPDSNCHLFTNASPTEGNVGITIKDIRVNGNGDKQKKPESSKSLTFCCAIYLRNVRSCLVENCHFDNIRQTAAHFNGSVGVVIQELYAKNLGWSGVSTSNTSNIWVQAKVDNSGQDIMHSAIHVDGGIGVYLDAVVENSTGNGIMLDSAYAPLMNVVIKGRGVNCRRGVSLSGAAVKPLRNVYIEGVYNDNREVGVMVSNSESVVINNSEICRNGQYGILLQGRNGGRNCLVVDSNVTDNPVNFGQLHASGSNWVFADPRLADEAGSWDVSAKSLTGAERTMPSWKERVEKHS